jgi:aminopeptidase N
MLEPVAGFIVTDDHAFFEERWSMVSRHRLIGIAVALLLLLVLPATAAAAPGGNGKGTPIVGAQTLGDPLLPQIGNGGYDVRHYRIALDYDPAANVFNSAKTTIRATAEAKLKEFSLDFQDLDVARVTVNGREADFSQVDATPQLSSDPVVTQPMKLVVRPQPSSRPKAGQHFKVNVRYSGAPEPITDADTSIEGWIPACFPLNPPQTCDGAFVVNEPIGAQSWFPSNNYPSDKATFDTFIRVPAGKTALGVGENVGNRAHGDGTVTWHWHEDDPTATSLTTATVGDFDYTAGSMTEAATGRTLPVYDAVDSTATGAQKAAIQASLDQIPAQVNYIGGLYGPYPFDSTGAVADRAAGVGYALEVQGKPHFAGGFTSGNPSIGAGTLLHELAHQWFGDNVTLATWADIWFNEGWANWTEWYWDFQTQGGDDPAAIFADLYATTPDEDWATAPAILDGDPASLFAFFPTYQRGAMTVEGYREIVGDQRFFAFARGLMSDHRHGNISTATFIAEAEQASGLTGAELDLLDQYFQQWLYGESKPTILPDDFA